MQYFPFGLRQPAAAFREIALLSAAESPSESQIRSRLPNQKLQQAVAFQGQPGLRQPAAAFRETALLVRRSLGEGWAVSGGLVRNKSRAKVASFFYAAAMPAPIRPVALFDFDGTIMPWDTQKLFCHYVLQRQPQRRLFLLAYVALLPFASILGSEGLKRVFLSFLWRMKQEEVAELARGFAEQWLPAQAWPEMLALLESHRLRGDMTILVSASPEPYVKEFGRILGFDLSLGTQIEFPDEGLLLFPDLVNNKGWQKVTRLHQVLDPSYFNGEQLHHAHGYTDSTADLPMLTLCQTATVVNPSPRLRTIAEEKGWQVMNLPRPWKNRLHRYWHRLKYVTGL